ncbi:hypothetical protein PHET_12333 [Paragonimus heterotremus]|uniref:PA domain-containing protein n=1 Tax=Paragonimus heterotremus TaxID=100268 RepID=A0A8J4SJ76_9TREM|nr:hypothetical protein PHET_12333 [Paragonimus heterotremus]
MYKYLLLLALSALTDSLIQSIGYVYLRVLDPPDVPFMMKLSLAHIGPAFVFAFVFLLKHCLVECNLCKLPYSNCTGEFLPRSFGNSPQSKTACRFHCSYYARVILLLRSIIAVSGCSFVGKIINAHVSGAVAAIVYDSNPLASHTLNMIQDETSRKVLIPSTFMSGRDG